MNCLYTIMTYKNLVLVTSVIRPTNKPLSYIATRSVFTPNERFEQTHKTLDSIRKKIPQSKIFLVECSDLSTQETEYFKSSCDYFLNLYSLENIRPMIQCISKSLCEGVMTICALEHLQTFDDIFENMFKISGRYFLSDNFEYDNFNNANTVIKYIDRNNVLTALFKIPMTVVDDLREFLISHLQDMTYCIGYELLFGKFMSSQKNIIHLDHIGLSGYVSVSGEYYEG